MNSGRYGNVLCVALVVLYILNESIRDFKHILSEVPCVCISVAAVRCDLPEKDDDELRVLV